MRAQSENSDGRWQIAWYDGAQMWTRWEVGSGGDSGPVMLGPAGAHFSDDAGMTMGRKKNGALRVVATSTSGPVQVRIDQVGPNGAWESNWTPWP